MKNIIPAVCLVIFCTGVSGDVDVVTGGAMESMSKDNDYEAIDKPISEEDKALQQELYDAIFGDLTREEIDHKITGIADDELEAMESESKMEVLNDAMLTPDSQQSHDLKMAIFASVGEMVDLPLAKKIAKCADAAAHPDDPQKYGRGVDFSKINVSKAILHCEDAYQNGGSQYGLVTTSLSRTYNKMEDDQQSIKYAKEAIAVGYPYGDALMGVYFFLGEGVKKNLVISHSWYEKGAKKDVTVSMRVLSDNYAEGTGTEKDLDKSLYWALKAVNLKDKKAFYNLGFVLEKMAEAKPNSSPYYKLSKEAFEIADANFVDSKQEIARINKKLNPNSIAETAVLSTPTIKGQMIGGVFIRDEADLNWYMGEGLLKKQGSDYLYARVSHQNSIFTLWYKHSPNNTDTGWYVDFFYAGSDHITDFKHVSVSSFSEFVQTGTSAMRLDASDLKVQELADGYRLTAKITYRDVLALKNGESVSVHFKTKQGGTPSYGLTLNKEEETSQQYASNIVAELITKAKTLQPSCCQQPVVIPATKEYFVYYDACDQEGTDHITRKQRIRQNCHSFLKNARAYDDVIMSNRLDRGISRFLQEVDSFTSKSDNKINTNADIAVSEDFIFSDSHQRLLKRHELVGLSKPMLRIARNEIFARQGRYFDSPDLQKHFGLYSWYKPYTWDSKLNEIERENVDLINNVERN